MARRGHRLHGVVAVGGGEPRRARGGQHPGDRAPPEDAPAPAPAGPVEHHVAGQRAQEAHRQRQPPPRQPLVAQHAGGEDRHLFRDRQAQAAEQQAGQDAPVREAREELLEDRHGRALAGCG